MTRRLLRYARASHGALDQNPAHNVAMHQALVHYASGAVYSFIPKNACTPMRYSLALANGAISGPKDFVWIHRNNGTFAADLRDLATAPYTYVILRCPHARLASAFLDKIVGKTGEAWALRHTAKNSFDLDDLTFRAFVGLLKKPAIRDSNIHWRPQIDFLVYEEYDSWFCLERFADATAEIEARTGIVVHDTRPLMRHEASQYTPETGPGFADMPLAEIAALQRNGRSPSHAALYEDDLAATVARLYRGDLALYRKRCGPEGLLFPDVSL